MKQELSTNGLIQVRKFRNNYLKEIIIGLVIIIILSYLLGTIESCKKFFYFEDNCYYKDIVIAIISLSAVLLGFLITGLSIFVGNIQNQRNSIQNEPEKLQKINDYWKYIIKISQYPIYTIFVEIIIFIFILTLNKTLIYSNLIKYIFPFCILLTILIIYRIIIPFIFDYLSNPSIE